MSRDRAFDVVGMVGVVLLGGGVTALVGVPWACILWGSMFIGASLFRGWRAGLRGGDR